MTIRARAHLAILSAAIVAVAVACGGGPAPGGPSGVVTSALDAVESGGFGRLTDFACAAQADDVMSMFGNAGSLDQLTGMGVDAQELINSMKIDFQDVTATETAKSDAAATVHVAGKMALSFDEAKFRTVMKSILTAQGLPADDATIDAAMTMMAGQMTQTQTIDDDVTLIQENGKWVICE